MTSERITGNIVYLCKGFSRQALSKQFQVKEKTFSAYLEGRSIPKIDTLILIADYFNISIDRLVREDLSKTVEVEVSVNIQNKRKK